MDFQNDDWSNLDMVNDIETYAIVGVSLDVFLGFFAILAVVIVVMYRSMVALERKRRAAFLASHDPAALLINRYKPKVVYRVLDNDGATVEATVVWRGAYPEKDNEVFQAGAEHFAPFDKDAFAGEARVR